MNKMSTFIVLAGIAALGACASDEAVMNHEADTDDMTTQQPAAAAPAAMADASSQDEDMSADEAVSEPAPAAAAADTGSTAYGSGDLVSTCTHGSQTRVISVVYDNAATGNVCEVTYEKSTGIQTLWSAQNERDYCLDKALAFVEKQKGWGWSCSNLE